MIAAKMLEIVAIALAIAAAAGVTAFAVKGRRGGKAPKALPAPRRADRGELKPSDVITYLGNDFLVEGVASFDEGAGVTLTLARLVGEGETRYLAVDPRGEAPPAILSRQQADDAGGALPRWLHDSGIELRLSSRSAGRITLSGELAELLAGPCDAGRYEGPGGRVGVVLLSADAELVMTGQAIVAAGLILLPGGG